MSDQPNIFATELALKVRRELDAMKRAAIAWDTDRRARLRRRASWDAPEDLEHSHDVHDELEAHGALRTAITTLRDNIVCLGGGIGPCNDATCTRCILTDALLSERGPLLDSELALMLADADQEVARLRKELKALRALNNGGTT